MNRKRLNLLLVSSFFILNNINVNAQSLRDEEPNITSTSSNGAVNVNIYSNGQLQSSQNGQDIYIAGQNVNSNPSSLTRMSSNQPQSAGFSTISVQPMGSINNASEPQLTSASQLRMEQSNILPPASNNVAPTNSLNGIDKLPPLPSVPESAFKNAREALTPINKEEIDLIKGDIDNTSKWLKTPHVNRKPVIRDQIIDLSAGSTPPLVRPGKNYGSVITFIDETGAPWNIVGADGMSNDFTIRWAAGTFNKKRTAIQIVPSVHYGTGNISVMLEGLEIPIIVSVEIGYSKEVDYRVDFRIPLRSPNARAEVAPMPMPSNLPKFIGDIMQGVPPSYAKRLKVSNDEGMAYMVEGKLVWRTNLTLLSPIPIGYLPSINGTRVYYMEYTPVVFASDVNGNRKQITISEMN